MKGDFSDMEKRNNVGSTTACITRQLIDEYGAWLYKQERSGATIEKYLRDVKNFYGFLTRSGNEEFDWQRVMEYKDHLTRQYKVTSVNSMLAAVNSYFEFLGLEEFRVKLMKLPRELGNRMDIELTESDYNQLIETAEKKGDIRMSMLFQTISSTGIRIGELKFVTVESLDKGYVEIDNEEKSRIVLLSAEFIDMLRQYCEGAGITQGSIFVTRGGQLMDRSNINKKMKELGREAGIDERKLFPHNLRHLCVKAFYRVEKEEVCLRDIRGYSNRSLLRIYAFNRKMQHRPFLSRMEMVIDL